MKKLIQAFKEGFMEGRNPPLRGDGQPIRIQTCNAQPSRQSVEVTVLRACDNCHAPGVYKSDEEIEQGWPGCWVQSGSVLENQSVGQRCPNCGHKRPTSEVLGEVWVREYK